MHSSFRKLNFLIAFGAFFAALSLGGGCTNLFSSNSPNNEAVTQIRAKEGYGIVTGSVPSANSASARTAMPDPDKNTPDSYRVFAQSENGLTIIEANVNQATKKFSIQLPYGTWNVTAQGLSAGKVIYSETKKITLNAANSQVDLKFTLGYSTNPDDGIGEVSLSVSFPPPASSKITAVEYILSKGENKIVVKITEEELAAGTFKIKRIFKDLGTYTLTINFYGDFANLVYLINQKVQVYANLCTDKFVGNAAYISGGDIVLTADLLKEFENTTLYVNANTGNDSNSGTRFDPLKTFYRAVEMVNNASVDPADGFRIFLQTNVADGAFLELQSGKKLTVASADGTARTIESLERRFSVLGTSELTVKDIKFQKMSFRVVGALDMIDCEISGNTKNESGGAIYVDGGKASISDVKIFGNSVTANGGAVYVAGGGTFTMDSSTITENKISYLGEVLPGTISHNGAGVYVDGGTFMMKSGTISKNTALYGGALDVDEAFNGGGVCIVGNGSFTMEAGEISGNQVTSYGGAVCVYIGTFTMNGGKISENTATHNGGGVFVHKQGEFTAKDFEISSNKAKNGGGVCIVGGGSFTMASGTISENTAAKIGDTTTEEYYEGGGVFVVDDNSTFTMNGGTISENKAIATSIGEDTGGNGGGVHVGKGGKFTMASGATISENTATNDGGGVHVFESTFEMNGGTIIGNEATNSSTAQDAWASGGGVFVYDGSFTMKGNSTISENKAKSSGGGVYSDHGSMFEMQGGTIGGNTANGGGGVAINIDGIFKMSGGTIGGTGNGNSAEYAGGVSIDNGGSFTMTGGTISNNEAKYVGGGVSFDNGSSFTMEAGTISNNEAQDSGGGVFINGGCKFEMSGGTISENTAASNAGGVFVHRGATFTMSGSSTLISKNTATNEAGGVYVDVGSSFTMKNGTVSENKGAQYGGGVFVVGDSTGDALSGTFTMENGTISGNEASTEGGGVCIHNGIFTMQDGTITENKAISDNSFGGGIYLHRFMPTTPGGIFTMQGGTISENSAANGGGLYATNFIEFVMTGGTFSENEAKENGSGIYANPGATAFKMGGAVKFEKDDDIYLDNQSTIYAKITITSALTATGTVATITPSTYNEGREILTAGVGITKAQMQTICGQFALTPETVTGDPTEYTPTKWRILLDSSNSGILGKMQTDLYVSGETGNDDNLGTKENPFKTMEKAIETLKDLNDGTSEFAIYVHGQISPRDSDGEAMADFSNFEKPLNLTIQPFPEEATATLHAGGSKRVLSVPASLSGLELTLKNLVLTNGRVNNNSGGAAQILAGTVTMTGCEVKSSTANYGGGAYFANGKFTLEGCNFTGNKANYGGGISVESGTLTMESCIFNTNTANSDGGGVFVEVHGALTMTDCEVDGNEAQYGGGVYVDTGSVTMKGGTVNSNKAQEGAGVYSAAGSFTMEGDAVVNENTASSIGGGILVRSGGTLTLTLTVKGNAVISENKAKHGAGVYIKDSGSQFTMTGGKIDTNIAESWGGGVYIDSGTFTMQNATISGNEANYGGGIRIDSGTVRIEGSSSAIKGNTATSFGGGVHITGSSTQFTMSNGEISGNNAETGAGVYFGASTFTMSGGKIIGNNTVRHNANSADGGGVYLAGGTFAMSGSSAINGNNGAYGGGVHINTGTLTMSDNCTINGNTSTGDGGGVYIASNGAFTMNGGEISNNDAQGNTTTGTSAGTSGGGGVYVFREPNAGTNAQGIFTMNGGTITNNTASVSKKGNGVFVSPNGTFRMSGGAKVVANNDVYLNVYSDLNSSIPTITVTDTLTAASPVATITPASYVADRQVLSGGVTITQAICEQFALSNAGWEIVSNSTGSYGVIQKEAHEFYVRGTGNGWYKENGKDSITGSDTNSGTQDTPFATLQKAVNRVIEKNDRASEYTIYVDGTLTGTAAQVSFNGLGSTHLNLTIKALSESTKATLNANKVGRLVSIYGGSGLELTLQNLVLTGGFVGGSNYGGGVYINGSTLTMEGVEINGNDADYGGGVYVNSGTFTMKSGTISGNKSTSYGGGMYVWAGTVTMSGSSKISGNISTGGAGGVYVANGGTFTMEGGTISGNSAGTSDYGGGVYFRGDTFTMTGGEISSNEAYAGGGVCIGSGTFTMEGGTISGNKSTNYGGGVYVLTRNLFIMNKGTISSNEAYAGGGVYVSSGTFTMEGGTITENIVDEDGGGVHISTGTFTMNNGTISKNRADGGGGVYVWAGTVTMEDGTISGNTATNGGGVCVWASTVTMEDGTINGNTATQKGGGVYVWSGNFVREGGAVTGNTPDNIYE